MRTLEKVDIGKLGMLPKTFNLESGKPLDGTSYHLISEVFIRLSLF